MVGLPLGFGFLVKTHGEFHLHHFWFHGWRSSRDSSGPRVSATRHLPLGLVILWYGQDGLREFSFASGVSNQSPTFTFRSIVEFLRRSTSASHWRDVDPLLLNNQASPIRLAKSRNTFGFQYGLSIGSDGDQTEAKISLCGWSRHPYVTRLRTCMREGCLS